MFGPTINPVTVRCRQGIARCCSRRESNVSTQRRIAMRLILIKLSTAVLGLLAIAQASQAFAAQAQTSQIVFAVSKERRVIESEGRAVAPPQAPASQIDSAQPEERRVESEPAVD